MRVAAGAAARPATTSRRCAAGGTVDADGAALLRAVVAARLAFLVVGGTGSGKTTLLAALLGEVAPGERIVCVEDAEELRPAHPHVVRMVARPANVEGAGQVLLRDLVRQALRMRPDRLVVGEVRGAEVVELLAALNTGHDGGAGTVHANAPREVPARLEALAALGGLGRAALHSQLAAAVQVVLQVRRDRDGTRTLDAVGVLRRREGAGEVVVVPAWSRGDGWAAGRADLGRDAARAGRRAAVGRTRRTRPSRRPSRRAPRAVGVAAGVSVLHRESGVSGRGAPPAGAVALVSWPAPVPAWRVGGSLPGRRRGAGPRPLRPALARRGVAPPRGRGPRRGARRPRWRLWPRSRSPRPCTASGGDDGAERDRAAAPPGSRRRWRRSPRRSAPGRPRPPRPAPRGRRPPVAARVMALVGATAHLGGDVPAALRAARAREPVVAEHLDRLAGAWALAERHGIALAGPAAAVARTSGSARGSPADCGRASRVRARPPPCSRGCRCSGCCSARGSARGRGRCSPAG